MPQGSVLGPILFSLYTTPLSKVIQNHPGISFQFYADDTQLYVHLTHKNVASALDKLSQCLEDVKRWLSTNKLKLNPDIRPNSLCLAQNLSVKNLITCSQSTYSVILYHQQMQLGTLVSGLIQISYSLVML